jgi:hypothetical protein
MDREAVTRCTQERRWPSCLKVVDVERSVTGQYCGGWALPDMRHLRIKGVMRIDFLDSEVIVSRRQQRPAVRHRSNLDVRFAPKAETGRDVIASHNASKAAHFFHAARDW